MSNITIDFLQRKDIEALYNAFKEQGWENNKPLSQFQRYYQEHKNNQRIVVVCKVDENIAGYCTLKFNAKNGPFKDKDIPEIKDFNTLIKYRGKGIGTMILDKIENIASNYNQYVSLAVGLYKDYGVAQRMYVKRNYMPDGTGIWYKDKQVIPGDSYPVDDDLLLYFIKKLY